MFSKLYNYIVNPLLNNSFISSVTSKLNTEARSSLNLEDRECFISSLAQEVLSHSPSESSIRGVVASLQNREDQDVLTRKIEAIRHQDIVCNKSEKELESKITGIVPNICICVEGIQRILGGKQFEEELDIYDVIKYGKQKFIDYNFVGNEGIIDVIRTVNVDRERGRYPQLIGVFPGYFQGTDKSTSSTTKAMPLISPYKKLVSLGFQEILSRLKEITKNRQETICGILQWKDKILLLYFTGDQGVLFDANRKEYHGDEVGASVMHFSSIQEMDEYLRAAISDPLSFYTVTFVSFEKD